MCGITAAILRDARGTARHGFLGTARWHGTVGHCGTARLGTERCSMARHGTARIRVHTIPYHTIPYHTIPYHTIPYHTTAYHGMAWHGMVWYGMLWYGMVWYGTSMHDTAILAIQHFLHKQASGQRSRHENWTIRLQITCRVFFVSIILDILTHI